MKKTVYLDYNATAPIRSDVITCVSSVMAEWGNPSSVHAAGRKARGRVETARRQVAHLVGCKPQEVIFTSGGTEANNLALKGFPAHQWMVSRAEHDSVLAMVADYDVLLVDLEPSGKLDLQDLKEKLTAANGPVLVSVMYANNETGILQPLPEIVELVHEFGGIVHTDAIQAAGKIPIDFKAVGADMMSLSAHKIGGPQGQGALIVREGLAIKSVQKGGGQELGRRGGTENVAGIAGFGVATDLALQELSGLSEIRKLRDEMEKSICDAVPDVRIYGADQSRLPNTSCLSMPGVSAQLQVMNFDLEGFAVSAGSACSSGKVKASHVLRAMGATEAEADQAIRISLGRLTKRAEIDTFIETWKKIYRSKSK
ncbi:cysteine desulfurase family protein [Sneathiella sp.]|jgi:cysteine desulfurase|uniref:cysteine desulfurase family protein n=1 Tax=Sneathiella sp. TaxID=1964365 RepID=UPI0039E49AA5